MTRKTKKILTKIALSDGTDALKLLGGKSLSEDELKKLNIFDVAQIKIGDKGGGEIRFVDRLEAIKMLEREETKGGADIGMSFVEALKEAAK